MNCGSFLSQSNALKPSCVFFFDSSGTVRAISTCGSNKVMRKIEMDLIIKLHEAVTVPTLLYGAETWPLNATIKKNVDKIKIWAWKSMIGLPKTTPSAAVLFCSGALYPSILRWPRPPKFTPTMMSILWWPRLGKKMIFSAYKLSAMTISFVRVSMF